MKASFLGTYLQDHLSGAAAALELLKRLEKAFDRRAMGRFAERLQEEILWERSQLESLAKDFPVASALPRKMAAWLAEKGLEFKLSMDGSGEDAFRVLESLEALSVGVAGKRLLWRALRALSRENPALRSLDYPRLIAMATAQRKDIEAFRLAAAEEAFSKEIGLAKEGGGGKTVLTL